MSYTKNGVFICDHCGKFAKQFDSYTPYGCSNPCDPEPYDPTEICESCSQKEEAHRLEQFKRGSIYGDWMKSIAEQNAAEKMSLIWDNSKFQYVPKPMTNSVELKEGYENKED